MSVIVDTKYGRLRAALNTAGKREWVLECPGCGQWVHLDDDQLHDRVSVDHASDGCVGGYHETHNFAAELPVEGS